MNSNDLIRRRDLLPEAVYYIIADPKEALDELLKRCKTAPAVNAVEVVRCKECEFAKAAGFKTISGNHAYWCKNISRDGCTQVMDADDYCSYGCQRRNEHET